MRLRGIIQRLRSCKTTSDEWDICARELAKLRSRTSLNNIFDVESINKLILMYHFGHDISFGQMECIKAISQPYLQDKRSGYLGISLILDSSCEVVMLSTHNIQQDLKSFRTNNPFRCSHALSALACIASPTMSNELAGDVKNIIMGQSAYLKRKAIACSAQLVRKNPILGRIFVECGIKLVMEISQGIVLGGLILLTSIVDSFKNIEDEIEKTYIMDTIRKGFLVDSLTKVLAVLIDAGEEKKCIINPILIIKLIRLIRKITYIDKNSLSRNTFSSVLVGISIRVDLEDSSGPAILLETLVAAILMYNAYDTPDTMTIGDNVLHKLVNSSNATHRYAALDNLFRYGKFCVKSVVKHNPLILKCLVSNDLDSFIRVFHLVLYGIDEMAKSVVPVLVDYLKNIKKFESNMFTEKINKSQKQETISKLTCELLLAVERSELNCTIWAFDIVLDILSNMDDCDYRTDFDVDEAIIASAARTISKIISAEEDTTLSKRITPNLWSLLFPSESSSFGSEDKKDFKNVTNVEILVMYILSTYANKILDSKMVSELIDFIAKISDFVEDQSGRLSFIVSYAITALFKLFIHFQTYKSNIRDVMISFLRFNQLIYPETSQRMAEYISILSGDVNLRSLETMFGSPSNMHLPMKREQLVESAFSSELKQENVSDALRTSHPTQYVVDVDFLISDVDPSLYAKASAVDISKEGSLMTNKPGHFAPFEVSSYDRNVFFKSETLHIFIVCNNFISDKIAEFVLYFFNPSTSISIEKLVFQIAVPCSLSHTIHSPSSNRIPPKSYIFQSLSVFNAHSPFDIKFRFKTNFILGMCPYNYTADFFDVSSVVNSTPF